MSDMSPELIGILSVGASLAALIVAVLAWLRQDMKEQGQELRNMITEQGQELRNMITEQGQKHSDEITEVKIEVASLKATVETYFRVRVDPPQTAAVAEPPEDYGAD